MEKLKRNLIYATFKILPYFFFMYTHEKKQEMKGFTLSLIVEGKC